MVAIRGTGGAWAVAFAEIVSAGESLARADALEGGSETVVFANGTVPLAAPTSVWFSKAAGWLTGGGDGDGDGDAWRRSLEKTAIGKSSPARRLESCALLMGTGGFPSRVMVFTIPGRSSTPPVISSWDGAGARTGIEKPSFGAKVSRRVTLASWDLGMTPGTGDGDGDGT